MAEIITRSNTVSLSFEFLDNTGEAATLSSATCQLVYPGHSDHETELLTLTETGDTWDATWDSTKSRGGWVEYHAHAIATNSDELTQDGRFKLKSNRANYQHDALPLVNSDYDYARE